MSLYNDPLRFSFRSPGIHSLPVELLTRIFVLGAGYDFPYAGSPFLLKPDQDYYAIPSSNFQLLVSHICRHWRQIALNTSSLWNILHFRAPEHLPRAQEYLNRCSAPGHLLDILVDTVAEQDYLPGITLFRTEIQRIFDIIRPHVKRWRSFHLKIRDHDCKATARQHLSSCGPAPNLETLQLYHFEDYLTVQNLYLATYRPPVVVFSNDLPRLRNVSLIGVNLPWAQSPYLAHLHNLELALHPENIRPPYEYWENMLRNSPDLQTLSLHYSGPRLANGDVKLVWPTDRERIYIESLENLSLTDLDPDYLCLLMSRLVLPGLKRLSLDLPDQDFTPFLELAAGPASAPSPSTPLVAALPSPTTPTSPSSTHSIGSTSPTLSPSHFSDCPFPVLSRLETLIITALECNSESLRTFLRALQGLRTLEVHFTRVSDSFFDILVEGVDVEVPGDSSLSESTANAAYPRLDVKSVSSAMSSCLKITSKASSAFVWRVPLLPRLQTFKMSGLRGEKVEQLIRYRECEDTRWSRNMKDDELYTRYRVERWVVRWSERWRGRDVILDRLVERGWEGEDGRRVRVEPFQEEGDDEEEEDEEDDDDELEGRGEIEEIGDDDEDEGGTN